MRLLCYVCKRTESTAFNMIYINYKEQFWFLFRTIIKIVLTNIRRQYIFCAIWANFYPWKYIITFQWIDKLPGIWTTRWRNVWRTKCIASFSNGMYGMPMRPLMALITSSETVVFVIRFNVEHNKRSFSKAIILSHLSGTQGREMLYDPGSVFYLKLVGLRYWDSEMTLKKYG